MKKESKLILVPVDFHEASTKAAHYAVKLAKRLHSEVLLLNIIETPGLLAKFFESGNLLVQVTDTAKEQLQALVEELEKVDPQVTVHTRVDRGKPYDRILQNCKEGEVRMIILGENHVGEAAEKELGTTVYHVTLKSPVPVLTLKGETDGAFGKNIVVPLDLAVESRKQLYSALVYGLNYNAKIHLVSSLVPGVKVRQSLIYKKIKKAKEAMELNGVETEIKIFEKDREPSYQKVLDYAKSIDTSMILLMTHREGYNYDNYIGAFAHHLINESSVPVLSLTSSATRFNFREVMKTVVDPMGMFTKK
jgi:nucleotide-binding universal stress UspA family protein